MKTTIRFNPTTKRKDNQIQGKSTRKFWDSVSNDQNILGDGDDQDQEDSLWSRGNEIQYSVDGETPAGSAIHAARRTGGSSSNNYRN